MRVTHNSLKETDKPMAIEFLIELEFRNVDNFLRKEVYQTTQRKTLGARTRTNNKLNPHMTLGPGIAPRTHWWEASALTTAHQILYIINVLPCIRTGKNTTTSQG